MDALLEKFITVTPREVFIWLAALAVAGVFDFVWSGEQTRLFAFAVVIAVVFLTQIFTGDRGRQATPLLYIVAGWVSLFPAAHVALAAPIIIALAAPFMALNQKISVSGMPWWLRTVWLCPAVNASFPLWFIIWRRNQKAQPRHATRVVHR